jgi:hypothetical protein
VCLLVSHFEMGFQLMFETVMVGGWRCDGSQEPVRRHRGIEKTMMSTALGMLMMMPVVFGVGGYALVSRRP